MGNKGFTKKYKSTDELKGGGSGMNRTSKKKTISYAYESKINMTLPNIK